MGGNVHTQLARGRRFIACLLLLAFLVSSFGDGLIRQLVPEAHAAQGTIDPDAQALGTSHLLAGSQTVFVNDQTGYKFFRDAKGFCVYRKTTDGGASWSSTTTVDAQTDCEAIQVWYDKWTPGDTGTYIHIATLDSSADDIFYNRLDTNDDTLLMGTAPIDVSTNSGNSVLTFAVGTNAVSITKGTDGTIYTTANDASDSYVVECTTNCNLAASWTETGTNPLDLANDYDILVPLAGGNIMVIDRDVSLEDIRYKIWDNSSWSASWSFIDTQATDNTTYDVGMAVTVSPTTGALYLAYIASSTALGADDQIRTAMYSGGSWTTKKEVIRYTERGITNLAIALDTSNDDVYVAYSVDSVPTTLTSGNIYWRKSTDDMTSWSYEYGPISASSDNIYGVDLNLTSSERIYVSWFDLTDADIYGDTIADIFPGIHVTTREFDEVNSSDSYSQVTLDSTAHTNGTSNIMSGSQSVFVSDQVGYKFYRDFGGYCVYTKTSDGGSTWSATTTVDAQTDCIDINVWYDRWTPGLSGTYIHIVTMDTGNDDIWYNRLDTNGDTLLMGTAPVSMLTGSGQGGTSLTEGENFTSITKGTDGTIYAISNDGSGVNDSFILECTANCNLAASWTETGTNPLDVASDQNLLVPLSGGSIMIINRDISLNTIRYRTWDNVNWGAGWTSLDTSATINTTYDVGMAVAVSTSTGNLYLAYIANNAALGTDDQVRTWLYSGGTWTAKTNVVAPTVLGLTGVSIALDSLNDDVYVAYSGPTTVATLTTANVLWKKSTDDMATWGNEQGPINTTPDNIYGVDLNRISSERLYVTWFDNTDKDIYGATLINLPSTPLQTTGSQITSTYASTSNVYIGGVFALYNTNEAQTYDVTAVTITEEGTIDGFRDISDVKLLYEKDTVAPYDCASVSYGGSEDQFGSTDTNGFSGANGVSTFSGTTVNISSTEALCLYPVMTVLDSANSSSTIDISIASPPSDVTVTSSTAGPTTEQNISGTTLVYNDFPTLVHYHFRNDDGSQATATSKTGGVEDTPLTALRQSTPFRVRMEISNEGSSTTLPLQFRLEVSSTTDMCSSTSNWIDVGATGGEFDMYNSTNTTDGANTTDIANATGGMTNENASFLTSNGAMKDTSSQTGDITLSRDDYVDLEYSIIASTTAREGNLYCFRVSNNGTAISSYEQYPQATIAADVSVTVATSSQIATTTIPSSNVYVGSAFVITENTSSRTVTGITITENGSVDGSTGINNLRLYYDTDTTSPYNCAGESYVGGERQFGATSTNGFSGSNGTSTFSGSVTISTTTTLCVYPVLDINSTAQNNDTLNIVINQPSSDVTVTSGAVGPSYMRDLNGSTTLLGAILTQTHYHWRKDNGTELTATSYSGGIEDTRITDISQATPVRLRLQVSNEGTVTSTSTALRLEYGAKISACSAVSSWTNVGEQNGAWDMYNSLNLTDGADTTDIPTTTLGSLTNENSLFLSPNGGIKDTSSVVATTTFTPTQFIEAEFSIKQTVDAAYDTTYCFRLTSQGTPLNAYSQYAELTTAPERDFEIQSNFTTITGTSTTLVAGVDYVTPSASSSAFIRITDVGMTGAGSNLGGTQNARNVTAYILDPSNIMSSVTIARPAGATGNTRVSWEIVEFIGAPGSDNEMIVRSQSSLTYATSSAIATGTPATVVSDDADIVVFITGQALPLNTATAYNTLLSTTAWASTTDEPVITRGSTSTSPATVSYAVVEFKGPNWIVQRSEHTYTSAGTTETEPITALGSLSRAFIHTQKRNTLPLNGQDEYGHEVWLSSIGFVSFFLQTGATTPSGITSVAWIIENTQTSSGGMDVTRSNGSPPGGTAPLTTSVPIGKTLTDLTNASIFINARSSGTGTTFPTPMMGARIASTTAYELWQSNTSATLTFRTEIVEWPTAGLSLRQNYYRFYVDNNSITPLDAWPSSTGTLGENTVLTGADNPLGEGEHVRIRMTVESVNATLPTATRAFRLQYGRMTTTCGAISEGNWATLGDSASSTIWRGYDATGTTDGTVLSENPPTGGSLLLSVSDVAGSLEEGNDSIANTYPALDGEDTEFDWIVEQNGAAAGTYYCFRMIESNGTVLDAYLQYPQLRTASFTARTQNWRWYDDEQNETPTTTLASENVAPTNIANGQALKLRVTVKETKNMSQDDTRFKLQYSELADFSVVNDVIATTSCLATSTWCYADGGGVDNEKIASSTLSDSSSCVAGVGNGCGTHNESPLQLTGFRHSASVAAEYSFTIQSAGPRVNRVYYFRLYDLIQGIPVLTNTGESYPSLATEGASLSFTMSGIASSTVVEGVTVDVSTTPTTIPFGTLPLNTSIEAAHRMSVDTNGTEGYQLFMVLSGNLMNYHGAAIAGVTGTNASPVAWDTGCPGSAPSCLGYHTGDDTLQGGSARFAAVDTYARLSTTTLEEVSYSSQPIINETTDIVFRILVRQLQDAGNYEAKIRYISVPMF